jgi:hypothetical protein
VKIDLNTYDTVNKSNHRKFASNFDFIAANDFLQKYGPIAEMMFTISIATEDEIFFTCQFLRSI